MVMVVGHGKVVAGRSGKDIADALRDVAASFLTEAEIAKLP